MADKGLEPGGLAMIIGAYTLTENIGKAGKLLRMVSDGDIYEAPNGKRYMHEGAPCWILGGDELLWINTSDEVSSGFALHIPSHLMPIHPEEDPLEVKEADLCHNQ